MLSAPLTQVCSVEGGWGVCPPHRGLDSDTEGKAGWALGCTRSLPCPHISCPGEVLCGSTAHAWWLPTLRLPEGCHPWPCSPLSPPLLPAQSRAHTTPEPPHPELPGLLLFTTSRVCHCGKRGLLLPKSTLARARPKVSPGRPEDPARGHSAPAHCVPSGGVWVWPLPGGLQPCSPLVLVTWGFPSTTHGPS